MLYHDIEFHLQFRNIDIELPHENRQYGNVFFRHYRGSRKEKYRLEEMLENRLAHSEIIEGLISGIEKEGQGADRRLAASLGKLQKAIASFHRDGLAVRLNCLADPADRLSQTVRFFQSRSQRLLLEALRNICAQRKLARNCGYVYSSNVRSMQVIVREYRKALEGYYNLLTGRLQQECETKGRVTIFSEVVVCLLELTELIRSRVIAINDCFNRLGEWKRRMRLAETQGIYN
ncbi:MAG TPA: hypothetical protein VN616_12335 [Puia sp.]|nr:hypothetical protein [Puia sp.]